MPRALITAFSPYDRFAENASWLALVELTRELPSIWQVTTRRYPVDFQQLKERLAQDLQQRPDYVLMLGQAPGTAAIQLEAIGLNVEGRPELRGAVYPRLVEDGPLAYQSALPLEQWAAGLRQLGIPAAVSYHAGVYLCNAALYLAHYYADKLGLETKAAFVHLPLDVAQAASEPCATPCLAAKESARAVRWLLEQVLGPAEHPASQAT